MTNNNVSKSNQAKKTNEKKKIKKAINQGKLSENNGINGFLHGRAFLT